MEYAPTRDDMKNSENKCNKWNSIFFTLVLLKMKQKMEICFHHLFQIKVYRYFLTISHIRVR